MVDALASDASRRHLLSQATRTTLFMRHGANLLVCAVVVAFPPAANAPGGRMFAAALATWSAYRLATRSASPVLLALDYATTVAACLMTPSLVLGPDFYLSNSAPVAIAGTAVISFTIATPMRLSLALAAGIAATFAAGASRVVGWGHVGDIFNLYYFALQWITASLIRTMVLRVADSVDTARADRVAVELQQQVAAAVRDYDREQLRLLHDTVASTLMMVGDGTTLTPERLAIQARRDLAVFSNAAASPQARVDLVAALRRNAEHVGTPIAFTGATSLWIDGGVATTVAAAAREALTNVDRHAGATAVTVAVEAGSVRITDDGRGFDPAQPTGRHGLASSILGRMRGLGGQAVVTSRPGHGTTVELRWPTGAQADPPPRQDPERLIERTRTGYGLALTAYAVANLLAMVPPAVRVSGNPLVQWVLAAVATVVTASSIGPILGARWMPVRVGVGALLAVALVQSVALPVDLLGTQAQWSQGVIGWCVLPLLLSAPARTAAGVLVGCWVIPAIYALIRDPSAHTVINLGYGTASILIIELCALVFNDLIRQAAGTASIETETRTRLAAAEGIAGAVQAEYQRRYADLADAIGPLLVVLAEGGVVDADSQRRAHIEYQRLRALFDQSTAFDHVVMRALRPLVDAAQDRGVAVSVTVAGQLPAGVDDDAARRLAGAIGPVLAAATVSARVTVSGAPSAVTLSAMCTGVNGAENLIRPAGGGDDRPDLTIVDDTVWITVRHQLAGGFRHHVLADNAS